MRAAAACRAVRHRACAGWGGRVQSLQQQQWRQQRQQQCRGAHFLAAAEDMDGGADRRREGTRTKIHAGVVLSFVGRPFRAQVSQRGQRRRKMEQQRYVEKEVRQALAAAGCLSAFDGDATRTATAAPAAPPWKKWRALSRADREMHGGCVLLHFNNVRIKPEWLATTGVVTPHMDMPALSRTLNRHLLQRDMCVLACVPLARQFRPLRELAWRDYTCILPVEWLLPNDALALPQEEHLYAMSVESALTRFREALRCFEGHDTPLHNLLSPSTLRSVRQRGDQPVSAIHQCDLQGQDDRGQWCFKYGKSTYVAVRVRTATAVMFQQLEYMLGAATAVARGVAPLFLVHAALETQMHVPVPMLPRHGMVCHAEGYAGLFNDIVLSAQDRVVDQDHALLEPAHEQQRRSFFWKAIMPCIHGDWADECKARRKRVRLLQQQQQQEQQRTGPQLTAEEHDVQEPVYGMDMSYPADSLLQWHHALQAERASRAASAPSTQAASSKRRALPEDPAEWDLDGLFPPGFQRALVAHLGISPGTHSRCVLLGLCNSWREGVLSPDLSQQELFRTVMRKGWLFYDGIGRGVQSRIVNAQTFDGAGEAGNADLATPRARPQQHQRQRRRQQQQQQQQQQEQQQQETGPLDMAARAAIFRDYDFLADFDQAVERAAAEEFEDEADQHEDEERRTD